MNTLATILAISISMAALLWLSHTDPKRRSAFRQPVFQGARRTGPAWAAALLPGLVVIPLAGGPGFVLWLGALGVVGWAVIAIPPGRENRLAHRLDRLIARARGRIGRLARSARGARAALRDRLASRPARLVPVGSPLAARVGELERKVMMLEAELARLRDAGGAGDTLARVDARVA